MSFVEWILEILERKVPERDRCWQLAEGTAVYGVKNESFPQAGPLLLNMFPDT